MAFPDLISFCTLFQMRFWLILFLSRKNCNYSAFRSNNNRSGATRCHLQDVSLWAGYFVSLQLWYCMKNL